MLDHLGLSVQDVERARAFYLAALAPLGYGIVLEVSAQETGATAFVGFGAGKPDFWIGAKPVLSGPVHVAFRAPNRAAVNAFYTAALAAGGRDNGPPGLRTDYHPNYYGAFVIDPDGHNVEAVCHAPE
ncbi:VOC family protein [Xanthobacter tagetidis]|jgi:catechol 2,3-dioxygenase-like lactoylglutathione lyase family enzyme|uniref:VOC family protein n=1 Tax=Xanthobacter tagetidis TaxID=60216 RepID=A0A3L7A9D7_9HYPH|nr:VOC family protein [Xanthobacter tagetidis]MBB6306502.1 catechol 2,3-dioxygenase-like lactoylglutathione lyase family enzyme [Xanthobacter tagetidis]RLP76191.1 VOC family protein [Xanthobacter tagetidis]